MVSRVARNPIEIPPGVDVKIAGQTVTVKGKLGRTASRRSSAGFDRTTGKRDSVDANA